MPSAAAPIVRAALRPLRVLPLLALALACAREAPAPAAQPAPAAGVPRQASAPAGVVEDDAERPAPGPAQEPALESDPAADGLADAALVAVEVVARDGTPVPDLEVVAVWRRSELEGGRTRRRTGPDGRVEFALWPGSLLIALGARPTFGTAPEVLSVNETLAARQRFERRITVGPAAQILGRVLDLEGRPVAGARVDVWFRLRWDVETPDPPEPDLFTTADERGIFLAGGLPKGPFLLEPVSAGMAATRRAGGLVEEAARLEGLELLLAPAQALQGVVLGSNDGAAVARAQIEAGRVGRKTKADPAGPPQVFYYPSRQRFAVSGPDGIFELAGVPEQERWNLAVRSLEHLEHRGEIEPGRGFLTIELEPGFVLSGLAVGPDGAPLADVDVRLRGALQRKLRTGADGRFRFPGLPMEEGWYLLFHRRGHAVAARGPLRAAADPGTELRVELEPGLALAGVVVDAAGTPLPAARVLLRPAPAPGSGPIAEKVFDLDSTVTTSEGRFRFEDLRAGRYALKVTAPGGAEVSLEAEAGGGELRITAG